MNPYWPADDAPQPHVIAGGNLEILGRRIRVTANVTELGGQTNHLPLADIEAWGRPAKTDQGAGRLDLQPIETSSSVRRSV